MGKLKLLALASIMLTLTTFNSFGALAKLTAYNDCERDSLPYKHLNCQGGRLEVGQCAADLRYHKLGENIYIDGMGTYVVSDCGSAIRGRNRYDIYVSTLSECNEFGVQYRNVEDTGKIVNQESKKIKKVMKHTNEENMDKMFIDNRSTEKLLVYSSKGHYDHHIVNNLYEEVACN